MTLVVAKEPGRFGKKHACAECGIRFYDLHKEVPTCPRCGVAPAGTAPVKLAVVPDPEEAHVTNR